jgi:hypothetical protein
LNIHIGMIQTPKELELELADEDGNAVIEQITEALGKEDGGVFWLTDRRGRRVGVVTSKLAWVEVGPESDSRRVGFSAL